MRTKNKILKDRLIDDLNFFAHNKDVPLNKLQVIGTHDSACFQLIRGHNGLALPKYVRPLMYFLPFVDYFVKKWTVTQSMKISKQLELGIRALDLRITYDAIRKDFYFTHTFFCIKADKLLDDISCHLAKNPLQFMFLIIKPDFAHTHTYTPEQDQKFQELLNSKLGTFFVTKSLTPNSFPTLQNVLTAKKNILCNVATSIVTDWNWGDEYFSGDWVNTTDDEAFYQGVKNFVISSEPQNTISYIPLMKTPDTETIKRDIKPSLLCSSDKGDGIYGWSKLVPPLLDRLEKDSESENFSINVNIFFVDYIY